MRGAPYASGIEMIGSRTGRAALAVLPALLAIAALIEWSQLNPDVATDAGTHQSDAERDAAASPITPWASRPASVNNMTELIIDQPHVDTCMRASGLDDARLVETFLRRASEAIHGNLSGRPFVFAHIPKNGGSTMTGLFRGAWKQAGCEEWAGQDPNVLAAARAFDAQCAVDPECAPPKEDNLPKLFGLWHDAACHFVHVRSDKPGFPVESLRLGMPIWGSPRIIGAGPLRYAVGHLMYGVCNYLPEGCIYTTVLREPVDRFLSHMWWECRPEAPEWLLARHGDACSSIAAFAQTAVAEGDTKIYQNFNNHQTRMISGDGFVGGNKISSLLTRVDLHIAIRNLIEKTPVWGHLDDMPSYMQRLSHAYGIQFPQETMSTPPRQNAAQGSFDNKSRRRLAAGPVATGRFATKPKAADIDPATYQLIERAVWLDIELYSLSSCLLTSPLFNSVFRSQPAAEQGARQQSVFDGVSEPATCDHVVEIQSSVSKGAALMMMSPTCSSGSRLKIDQRLLPNKALNSDNGLFVLRCEPDGNIVVSNCGGELQYVLGRGREEDDGRNSPSLLLRRSGVLELVWSPSSALASGNLIIATPHDEARMLCVDQLRLEDDGTLGLYTREDASLLRHVYTYGTPSTPHSNRSCSECRARKRLISSAHVIGNHQSGADQVCKTILHMHCAHSPAIAVNTVVPDTCPRSSVSSTEDEPFNAVQLATIQSHRRVITTLTKSVIHRKTGGGSGGGWHLVLEQDVEFPVGRSPIATRNEILGLLQAASDEGATLAHVGEGCSFSTSATTEAILRRKRTAPGREGKCAYAVTREGVL